MDYADCIRAVISRMSSLYVETPIAFGNDEFEPGAIDEYVRVWVRFGTADNVALGAGIVNGPGAVRHPGNIITQIFVRPKQGEVRAAEIGAHISQILTNEHFDGVRCYETSLIFASERTPDGWYQANATTVFDFDERKAA